MKSKNLFEKYRKLKGQVDGICYEMENYVLENYKKVPLKEWNDWYFKITPHLGQEKVTFGGAAYEPIKGRSEKLNKLFSEIAAKRKVITEINFTRDQDDDEFSVDFNAGTWTFLWEDEIVPYYRVVHGYLNR